MKRPVFVVGCPRSGTTLLSSMLVAAVPLAAASVTHQEK
jgi:Sulfotransferase family